MARTGTEENKQANQQYTAQQGAAFDTGQNSINKYNSYLRTGLQPYIDSLSKEKGSLGPNDPYASDIESLGKGAFAADQYKNNPAYAMDPHKAAEYLANQNRLRAGTLDSANNAATSELQDVNLRSGGLNTGATRAATTGLALQRMRLGNQLGAEQAASDYNTDIGLNRDAADKNIQNNQSSAQYLEGLKGQDIDINRQNAASQLAWKQYLASQKTGLASAYLAPADIEGSYYGTATGGRSSALGNLTQFGLAQYGPWNSLISAAGGAASAAAGKP